MNFKNIVSQLNIVGQCKRYGLSLWQCPQFLFLMMGLVIIVSTLAAYFIGNRYIGEPLVVALISICTTTILLIIATIITQSFERLAEASRLKSEFVSIVSHQLRSPLSNMKWTIEFLMSGKLGKGMVEESQLEYFKILKENTSRMGELVSDLLIVSRIDQGQFPIKKEMFSLKDILEERIEEMKVFAKALNVGVELSVASDLPDILADPSRIKLVVENLLDNAARYSKGRGKIKVSLEKKNDSLYCEVKDQGVGIPEKDKKHIFQKFFRSENALRHQTQGSGLGLYIAKSVIEKSGGKIGFNSEEGKGSTFWFSLPIK